MVFLERDDPFRPGQLPLQAAILDFELVHTGIDRLRHRPALARVLRDQLASLALPSPIHQVRTVQALAAQQRSQRAQLVARVCFLENATPVVCRELSAPDLRRHFRIWSGGA
jgi:hypothetical protein